MGMLKRMKDMKDMVEAAPGMIEQAQQLGAQAQQMAAAQQAAAQMQMAQYGQMGQMGGMQPGVAPTGPDFEPVAGVSLEQYAVISKGIAVYNYDQSKLPEVAAAHGVAAPAWEQAAAGWNERIKANPAVGQRFNALYQAS